MTATRARGTSAVAKQTTHEGLKTSARQWRLTVDLGLLPTAMVWVVLASSSTMGAKAIVDTEREPVADRIRLKLL
jgi:hypothetical protein